MATRCPHHRTVEPCYYCQRGMQGFKDIGEHLDAIEERFREAEHRGRFGGGGGGIDIKIGQAIGVIRDYALGDMVMLAPALKALKAKYPERQLALVTHPSLFDVLQGADYLDAVLPKHTYQKAHFWKKFDICGAAETEWGGTLPVEKYLSMSRPDVFAELLGVEGGARKFPIPVNPEALHAMQGLFGRFDNPVIGLAATCNSPVRTIPPEYIEPLAKKILAGYGGQLVLLGKTREWNRQLAGIKIPGVVNLIDSLEIKELIAAISLMDALITPDTGTMHVAGALEVKTLAVMGNNSPATFSDFYESVQVLQPTEIPCVPCRDRSIPCAPLPAGKYGADCMRAMPPERIYRAFQKVYNGRSIAYLHDTPLWCEGGAENASRWAVEKGRDLGYSIKVFDAAMTPEQIETLYNYDLVVLSNCWRFPINSLNLILKVLEKVPYVKYEMDNDGLNPRVTLGRNTRPDLAEKIYRNAKINIFQSPEQMRNYQIAYGLTGSVCTPPMIDVDMFENLTEERKLDTVLIGVPGKWNPENLKEYVSLHNSEATVTILTNRVPYKDWPSLLARYEYFAHVPAIKWPCDRVVFEAALAGCKVQAGSLVEAMSWRKDLTDIDGLKDWLRQAPEEFWGIIDSVIEGKGYGKSRQTG